MSVSAFAQDVGVVAGIRADNADGENNVTIGQRVNYQAGVVGKFELSGAVQVRTGLIYAQRAYEIRNQGDFVATYFEVPVGLLYKFSDYGGVFLGPSIAFNLSKNCPGGSCNNADVNASPLSVQFGGSFKVAPQFGFEVYYEAMTSKVAGSMQNPRAVIANVMLTFD